MKEIQGKSILVRVIIITRGRVSEGSSYRQSTLLRNEFFYEWLVVDFKNSRNRHGLRVTDLTIKRSTLRGKSNPPQHKHETSRLIIKLSSSSRRSSLRCDENFVIDSLASQYLDQAQQWAKQAKKDNERAKTSGRLYILLILQKSIPCLSA